MPRTLWSAARRPAKPPVNLDRGHPLSPARRAIDGLLPGQKYVLARGHNPSFVYQLNVQGPKQFATTKLPCGRLMVTRVA